MFRISVLALHSIHYGQLFPYLLSICILSSCTTDIQDIPELPEESPTQPALPEEDLTQERNLLKNGTCEEWSMGFAAGFNPTNYTKKEYTTIYEGKSSVKLFSPAKGKTAILKQRVEIIPGHHLRICHHYYIEKGKINGARMYCYFRKTLTENIPNDELNKLYDKKTLLIIRGGGYAQSYFPLQTGHWKTFDYVIKAPSTAIFFVFEIHSYYETTIYIDNCYVIDMDAAPSKQPTNQLTTLSINTCGSSGIAPLCVQT